MTNKNELEKLKKQNEHLESQLAMASRLKYHLMPNAYPAFPDVPDIDIYADSINIEQIGGDYYDFFRIDADHIGIVMADIFDGGTAAALYMVAFKTYLTSQISMEDSIENKMEMVNDNLCWENADDICLSAWYGIYEISSGTLRVVNAGHEPTYILRDSCVKECDSEIVSYIMGVAEKMKYASFEIKLEPGDKLLLYTDGVTDARSTLGEAYGKERLKSAYVKTQGKGAEETVAILEKDFSEYVKGSTLSEDASFLCLIRRGGDM